jgi:hypothetical protein
MSIKRRDFLQKSSTFTLGASMMNLVKLPKSYFVKKKDTNLKNETINTHSYLSKILYTKKEINDWFSGKAFPFSRFDSELGWLLPNARFQDGINNSISVYTYAANDGERLMCNYSENPCRINTYGNSFTQCHQVSDHETWQEVLAAHIQEPVRNFGIGGWSVYQAYLRMLKEEKRKPVQYIIFNIFEDDHKRNLDSWRNIRVRKHPQHIEATLPYLKINLDTKTITECKNPCPTPESYYNLCDIKKAYELFKDDFVLKIMIAHENAETKNISDGYDYLTDLIKTHGIKTKLDENENLAADAEKIHIKAALYSSEKIVEKMEKFAAENNKKILYVLSYPGKTIAKYIEKQIRFDQSFVDYLDKKNLPYIDLMEAHAQDFKKYRINMKDYINQYFIGHYNPLGNFFCAAALMEKVAEFLEPKPLPYLPL